MSRLAQIGPAGTVKDEYQQAFAPDFNISSGFEDPDQVVDDLREMTYTAYTDAAEAEDDYTEDEPLDDRLADAGVPVLVIFGRSGADHRRVGGRARGLSGGDPGRAHRRSSRRRATHRTWRRRRRSPP